MANSLVKGSSHSCPNGCRTKVVRRGHFRRSSDRCDVQRFKCFGCGKSFSEASFDPCYGQKKRQFNTTICRLLCGGYSQRRAAFDLGINRKTVVRKFLWSGRRAKEALVRFNLRQPKVSTIEFDDMETSEHTKFKPLSITLAVEHRRRRILGFRVSTMPARGALARLALKKYGRRIDGRRLARQSLFEELKPLVSESTIFKSDQNPHYAPDVKRHFPEHRHETFKGRRGCVVGQGELKRGGFDPLFSLNHTCAMLRANINRLYRRTWCTTKIKERLECHIALYAMYHNLHLIKSH